jgi:hypothetical protein
VAVALVDTDELGDVDLHVLGNLDRRLALDTNPLDGQRNEACFTGEIVAFIDRGA